MLIARKYLQPSQVIGRIICDVNCDPLYRVTDCKIDTIGHDVYTATRLDDGSVHEITGDECDYILDTHGSCVLDLGEGYGVELHLQVPDVLLVAHDAVGESTGRSVYNGMYSLMTKVRSELGCSLLYNHNRNNMFDCTGGGHFNHVLTSDHVAAPTMRLRQFGSEKVWVHCRAYDACSNAITLPRTGLDKYNVAVERIDLLVSEMVCDITGGPNPLPLPARTDADLAMENMMKK